MDQRGGGDDDAASVRVAVRVRPLSGREKVDRCDECVSVLADEQQIVMGKNRSFTYDYVFGQYSQQSDIWRCVDPLIKATFDGYNSTIFAYGQTGSGKTYTMGSGSSVHIAPEDYGIIPRVLTHIFEQVDAKTAENPLYKAEVRVRFLEIYGEEIRDLLVTLSESGADNKVTLREGEHGEVQVAGATEEAVFGGEDCLRLLERGSLCRTTGSTLMNAHSSRSHAIFTVTMVQHIPIGAPADGLDVPEGDYETRNSYFNFVDLAGSERQKRTQAEGKRLKEGIDINKGLLALGNVISALGDDKKRGKVHVPYRDSKLTRMLQDSLGGNSRTLMLTCVSPADVNFDETLNALKYANRARNIKNKPVVNRDEASALMLELRRQVEMLQAEVHRLRNPGLTDSELKFATVNTSIIGMQADFDSYGSLRDRAETAEREVARLTAELKRGKSQLDQLKNEMITAQSERDLFRLCLDEAGGSCMSPAEQETKMDVLQEQLRTIADLQEKLRATEQEKERAQLGFNEAGLLVSHRSISEPSSTIALPGFVDSAAKEGAELIEHVVKEIERDTALLEKLKNDTGENSGGASDGTAEGSADDNAANGVEVEATEEEADRQRVFQKRQRHLGDTVQELSHNISIKEEMVEKIRRSQENYERMRNFYEQKMAQMVEEVRTAQADRDKLAEEIQLLQYKVQSEGDTTGGNERLSKLSSELKAKEEELNALRRKQNELNRIVVLKKKNETQLRVLTSEISNMKRQKVDLIKKMADERKRYEEEAKQRRREIMSLKRSQQRDKQQIMKLGSQKEAQERVLKRKMEEMTAVKQRLKQQQQLNAQAKRMNAAHGRKPSTMKKADRDAKWLSEQVKKQAEEQHKLEQLRREREAVAKEMEALYAQRDKIEAEIMKPLSAQDSIRDVLMSPMQPSPLNRRNSKRLERELTPEEEQLIFDLEERIEACQARLEYKEEKLSEIADDGTVGTDAALVKIQSAQSLPEARTLLKTLFGMAVDVKKQDQSKEQELAKLQVEMAELTERLEQEREKTLQIKQSYEESLQRVIQAGTGGDMVDEQEPLDERARVLLSVSEERNSELKKKCGELKNVCESVTGENKALKARLAQDEQYMLESRERITWLEGQLARLKTTKSSNQMRDRRTRVQASTSRAQSLPVARDTTGPSEVGPASWANEQDDDDEDMDSGDHGDASYEDDIAMRDENDDTGDERFHSTFPGRQRREYRVDVEHMSDDTGSGPLSQRGRRSLITQRRSDGGEAGHGDDGDENHQYYRSDSPTVGSDDSLSTAPSIFSRLANPTNFTGIHKNRVRESLSKRELLQRTSDQKRSRRIKDRNQMRPPRATTPTDRTGGSFGFKTLPKKPSSMLEVLANIKRENESEQLGSSSGLRQPMSYVTADRPREHDDDDADTGAAPPPAPVDVYSRLAGQYTASAQSKLKHPQVARRSKHDEGDASAETFAASNEDEAHDDDGEEGGRAYTDDDEDLGDYDPLLGGSSSLVTQVHEDYRERLSQRGRVQPGAEV